jgi:2,3-bisphosphoglycerate-independent phosphoglycerate mutase
LSETEKYAHVTLFFNGQKEKANKGEDRVLIPSPKVATYDLKPQMSAGEIAERLVAEIGRKKYDLIVTNLVNCDMVGHTGKEKAIIKAVEAVDDAQGKIVSAGLAAGYSCLLLADHGNAEDKSPKTMTSHTTNPVPVILVTADPGLKKRRFAKGAGLKDVAPAILDILGQKIPKEMGKNILLT